MEARMISPRPIVFLRVLAPHSPDPISNQILLLDYAEQNHH